MGVWCDLELQRHQIGTITRFGQVDDLLEHLLDGPAREQRLQRRRVVDDEREQRLRVDLRPPIRHQERPPRQQSFQSLAKASHSRFGS